MARLIVAACSFEQIKPPNEGDYVSVRVGVSVSRADDGKPVTGLKAENFRVSFANGPFEDLAVVLTEPYSEWKWEPADVEPSGCYTVHIATTVGNKFLKGARYVFGIQARTFGLAPW